MTGLIAVPDKELTRTPSKPLLDAYVGKNVKDICGNQYQNDVDNHCAHFVSHALGFSFGFTCRGMTGKGDIGYSIRVQEIFSMCGTVGSWADCKETACLVFITNKHNVDLKRKKMANVPKKHVGIYLDGTIWHYSNSRDQVVTQTPAIFSLHYPGKDIAMFYGTFPR